MSNGTAAKSHLVAISAHKGGSENGQSGTLEAYAHAADTGAEYVEFDIRPTGDGELVVFHDSHMRQGDALAATSYARICALAGFEVPRVADVMRLIAGKAIGHLDLKAIGGEDEVVGMALDILGPGNFVVTSLEDESVAAIKARFPLVPVALSLGRDLKTVPRSKWAQIRLSELFPMRRIRACNADWAAVNRQLAAAGVLAQCHRNGITAMIWTVNEDNEIMRWLADSRVAVLITDRPAHAVALRATLRSGESLFQAGQERPHHLLSSPTRVTRSGRILRWFFPRGQRISGENKGEAVGWHGWPAHRWVDPHDTSLFHQSCWKKPKSVARVARMIEPALPRIQSIRPLPVEEPPGPWRLDSRQLPGRAVGGDLNTAWIDCWPTATNSRAA